MQTRTRSGPSQTAALLLVGTFLLASSPARAETYDGWMHGVAVGVDVVLVRPLMAARVIIGAVLFVPAYGLAAINGTEARAEVMEIFVTEPVAAVTREPLGDF